MDSTNWDKLKEAYKSAEDFLADMPIGKAIANVISNPTPQEIGAQVANLGSDISKSLSKTTENPVEAALNYGNMGGVIFKGYHGTSEPIKEFSKSFLGKSTGAKSALEGFWFVDNPEVAESYATYSAETAPVKRLMDEAEKWEKIADRTGNQKYYDKYDEALSNAEKLENDIAENRFRGQNIIPAELDIKKPKIIDAKGMPFSDVEDDINKTIKKAKKSGYDGVVIKNLDDSATFSNRPATHYLVFSPNQIRSSISKKIMSAEKFLEGD